MRAPVNTRPLIAPKAEMQTSALIKRPPILGKRVETVSVATASEAAVPWYPRVQRNAPLTSR
ncbi:MAG: hypothetical protein A2V98_21195 [Planctomycetes bacterium RBG_16_64_12]|nr:MAG: hypothetical protein A2V98_21195 [Planctomycetes bacterium RBG_16_64_12]